MTRAPLSFSLIAIASAVVCGCATTPAQSPNVLNIEEVWRRHDQLDGQIIRVQGIARECQRFGCAITDPSGSGNRTSYLALGGWPQIDRRLNRVIGRNVVLEGRLDSTCMHSPEEFPDIISICTDRASMLQNPRLISDAR